MSFGKKGQDKETVKQQSTTTISPEFMKFFNDPEKGLAPRAEAAMLAAPNTPYAGPFNAAVNPLEREALDLTAGAGRTALPGLQQGGQIGSNLALSTLRGDFLHPDSNPYLKSTIDAAIRPLTQQYRETFLPAIESRAFLEGAGDSIRLPLAQAQAGRDLATASGDIASNIAYGNYGAERQNQFNAPALMSQSAGLPLQAIQMIGGAGAGQRGLDQIAVQEGLAQRQEAEQARFRPLTSYANILSTIPVGSTTSGTQTTTRQQAQPGLGSQILTGALGAAGTAASLFGTGGAFPGALSGLGGSLFGGLSGGGSTGASISRGPPTFLGDHRARTGGWI